MDLLWDQSAANLFHTITIGPHKVYCMRQLYILYKYDYEIYISQLGKSNRARICVGGKNTGTLNIIGQILRNTNMFSVNSADNNYANCVCR